MLSKKGAVVVDVDGNRTFRFEAADAEPDLILANLKNHVIQLRKAGHTDYSIKEGYGADSRMLAYFEALEENPYAVDIHHAPEGGDKKSS